MIIKDNRKEKLLAYVREEIERGQHRTSQQELCKMFRLSSQTGVCNTLSSKLSRTEKKQRKMLPPKSTFILVEYAIIKLQDENLPITLLSLAQKTGLNRKTVSNCLERNYPALILEKNIKKTKPVKVKPARKSRISPKSLAIVNIVRRELKDIASGVSNYHSIYDEIGQMFGITRERVRQILKRGLTDEEQSTRRQLPTPKRKRTQRHQR